MARSAPGKHYRKGLTLAQLFKKFPDDAAAEKWFASQIWPNGPFCPHCGSDNVQSGIKHKTMTHRCRSCPNRRMFSMKTGTIMQGSPLGYQTWAMALYLMSTNLKGVSSLKLHRDLGISQKSAWYMAHRIREAWKEDRQGGIVNGEAEVDETYLGGKRKNMHRSKRKELKGRGAVGKTVVVGARSRRYHRVIARTVTVATGVELRAFVRENVEPGVKVYTDDHAGYRSLRQAHVSVNHSAGEYVRGMAHTNGIESFWSMLKRGYHGTFHWISPKHTDRYVTEFAGRNNARHADTEKIMGYLAKNMVGRRLKFTDLCAGRNGDMRIPPRFWSDTWRASV